MMAEDGGMSSTDLMMMMNRDDIAQVQRLEWMRGGILIIKIIG